MNLATLDVQQLGQVKKQLEEELEHLTSSFAQLHAVQGKFRECLRLVKARPGLPEGIARVPALGLLANETVDERSVLVPLTNSLYVRGKLSDPKHVIVDIGTGFYVEKVGPIATAVSACVGHQAYPTRGPGHWTGRGILRFKGQSNRRQHPRPRVHRPAEDG